MSKFEVYVLITGARPVWHQSALAGKDITLFGFIERSDNMLP